MWPDPAVLASTASRGLFGLDALAHAIPFAHSEASDPYIVIALTTIGVAFAIAAGLWLGSVAQASRSRTLVAALAAGALVFLLFDLLKESASLGQGLVSRPALQLALVLAFALGLVALGRFAPASARAAAWAWALGIAAHGAGEAWIVGTEALTADITAPAQAASFLVHKVVEGATIPLVAGAVVGRARLAQMTGALALVALAGAALGHWLGPGSAPTILFAAGAGAATWAILALARALPLDARHALAAAAGVALVWAAGVLHELA